MGTPQGGNLSPLLANIMLNELDKEMEQRCCQRCDKQQETKPIWISLNVRLLHRKGVKC